MNNALLAALLISGCSTTQNKSDGLEEAAKKDRTDIKVLQEDVRQLNYFISHDKCFIGYAVCLGEKKKDGKMCWKIHEACVIDVYHQWKDKK